MDRVFNTTKTGELLGGMHRNDVCMLIRSGKLAAKRISVRGRGGRPRYVVTESAIRDYIRSLPDATQAPAPRAKRRATLPDQITRFSALAS
jgi:hypothetical protein